MTIGSPLLYQARTDAQDWLIEADEPLAGLQRRAGGNLPGAIVAPALLDLVRKARSNGVTLARRIEARDDGEQISAWVEVEPGESGAGCRIRVSDWHSRPLRPDRAQQDDAHRARIARNIADFTARLGPDQEVLSAASHARDTAVLAHDMEAGAGRHWTEFVDLEEGRQSAWDDWQTFDNVRLRLPGSDRNWTARLFPLGRPVPGSAGYELALVAEEALADIETNSARTEQEDPARLGQEIAPALRQPVARIVANAETIRTQLAGPLAADYTNYAADIQAAGEHLLALIDDLADLEAMEDEQFSITIGRIDLTDAARRAAGLLAVRAQEKEIKIEAALDDKAVLASGEFRRVLQILLNLIGNAIRYSPVKSRIRITAESDGDRAYIVVADEGEGLNEEEQRKAFEKFERLGRKGDGGSGLGLYISRRLAWAMEGKLRVESARGQGARFILELPADPDAEA